MEEEEEEEEGGGGGGGGGGGEEEEEEDDDDEEGEEHTASFRRVEPCKFSGGTIFLVSLCRLLCYAHFLFIHALNYGTYFTFFFFCTKLIHVRRHYAEIS
jgi:hypothetical protein